MNENMLQRNLTAHIHSIVTFHDVALFRATGARNVLLDLQLEPRLVFLHAIRASQALLFPELRLIQYDCGESTGLEHGFDEDLGQSDMGAGFAQEHYLRYDRDAA
jgi:hypothetical protein